jgi:hypothetical protein
MLHALNNNREAIEALRYNGYGAADFQVNKSAVYFDNEFNETELVPYKGKDVYFRSDNGEPIAIHGKRYKPLQYTHMIDKSRDMLERCKLDATGIEEKIQVSPNGGMCLVNYKLPAKEYETPDGDTGCITVMALSSFNGVWSFILSLGFEQSACLNSQIFIKNPAALYKARHTGKLDIDRGANMLGKTANIIEQEIEMWTEWHNTPITKDDIHNAIADCADISRNTEEPYRNKNYQYIINAFALDYEPRMGRNRWALYNALTDWSTHAPSKSKNNIALLQRRGEKVAETLTHNFAVKIAA